MIEIIIYLIIIYIGAIAKDPGKDKEDKPPKRPRNREGF